MASTSRVLVVLAPALGVLALPLAWSLIRSPTPAIETVEAGEPCGGPRWCDRGLTCEEGTCITDEESRARHERRMLDEARTTMPPPAGDTRRLPFSVKVRTGTAERESFAQCAADERLVGGGCSFDRHQRDLTPRQSRPEAHGDDDTRGARWRCEVSSTNVPVTAYALCMWIPPDLAGEAPSAAKPGP